MRTSIVLLLAFAIAGCQMVAPGRPSGSRATATDDAMTRLVSLLNGEFDNHEQSLRNETTTKSVTAIPVPRLHHTLRLLEHDRDAAFFLWTVQSGGERSLSATWLFRVANVDGRIGLTPYRATSAAALGELSDPKHSFKFQPEQWGALEPCTQSGVWDNATFSAVANSGSCSVVLSGLGASAALLALKFSIDGDMLHTATFADLARGADAVEEARRVRWFGGWTAINGGGPAAKAANQDWHLRSDSRLSSEGGRAPIRWRDGAPSGYSLELERRAYPERGLNVLQLNVIEDANGKTITYVWTDTKSVSIGLNLGWLQVGLNEEKISNEGARP
jgi:hypothetical protein